jgi:tetratricopeptide (TPR) repeat protein
VKPQQQKAIDLMRQGLDHSSSHEPTPAMLAAALIVAQHWVNEGDADEAIEVLENASWGPKTLADQSHRLLQDVDLRQRVYLLSMMAYVGGLGTSASSESLIDKVTATLETMNAASQNDPAQQQQLASTYVVLARGLHEQIQSAPPARAAELTSAFAEFLERAVSTGQDLTILSWAAQAYADLGSALAAGSPDRTTAQAYYAKSIATYQELLRRSDAGHFTMTIQERLVLETRLATVLRDVGRYEEAVDRLATILQRQPNQVYVQMEAARTLHQWGDDGNPPAYLLAISGDRADAGSGQNLIWGYGRTARLIAGRGELEKLFYEARYALAECRFKYAMSLSGPERDSTLKQAEQDIVMTGRLYPELGGSKSKEEFQRLLRQIQQTMGKRPTG